VNGGFSFPSPGCPPSDAYCNIDYTVDTVDRRIQVELNDLNPPSNAGALYFGEVQYISKDELGFDRLNNASYRQVDNTALPALNISGNTIQQRPAIFAWQDIVPDVTIVHVDIPGDGRFTVAYKATDLGAGQSNYVIRDLQHELGPSGRVFLHTDSRRRRFD